MTNHINDGFLEEQDGHTVYWRTFGNPNGKPLLFFHGGPGGGFNEDYLHLFDLTKINFITFDQRGTGRSEPFGSIEKNTTIDILRDAERLRKHLQLEKWIVAGHSWGGTLSLQYARLFPDKCEKVFVSAYFGGHPENQDWAYGGVRIFIPEEIAAFENLRPQHEQKPVSTWILDTLNDPNADVDVLKEIVYRFNCVAAKITRLSPVAVNRAAIGPKEIAKAKIFFHYVVGDFFMSPPLSLVEGFEKVTIPIEALHGFLDLDAPPLQIIEMQKHIPQLKITQVAGGHNLMEEPMQSSYRALLRQLIP
ncbi:MAG: hypothetical protein A3B66_07285 [Alphaproteobacteria bacterium RIFCSPHIGHO2_02_FULL_46_13]|nr:MAG: hypothetical protein A3B66_07285 [Alphaproteobacteria bacterium RIFCSPHIGHO2_02_FULL_46_13]